MSAQADLMLFKMGCLCWLENSIMKAQRLLLDIDILL